MIILPVTLHCYVVPVDGVDALLQSTPCAPSTLLSSEVTGVLQAIFLILVTVQQGLFTITGKKTYQKLTNS